jgi:hypothetical protein
MLVKRSLRVSGFLILISIGLGVVGLGGQFYHHKSEGDLARMTPEQRAEEYCNEYARHGLYHLEYGELLDRYIFLQPLSVAAQMARIIDAYDPRNKSRSREKADRAYEACILVTSIDERAIRLRASAEGRTAILAMKQLSQNMLAAHFEKDEDIDQNRRRYELLISWVGEVEGVNYCDQAIENTLRLRYKIQFSEGELIRFVDYLITEDPYYPAWSAREEYKDLTQRNEAGNPIWYLIVKKPEPFYKAYLQFKAKSK